jgi:hypothetical protein
VNRIINELREAVDIFPEAHRPSTDKTEETLSF